MTDFYTCGPTPSRQAIILEGRDEFDGEEFNIVEAGTKPLTLTSSAARLIDHH